MSKGNLGYRRRKYRRKALKAFGLTAEDYDLMFKVQGGICAICDQPPTARRLGVDHDHKTLVIRELLCRSCNVGIGNFKENPALLIAAIDYLKRWGK